jgi:hypothetical protein
MVLSHSWMATSAGDNISEYTGTYVQDGDKFSAAIAVRRHTQGQPSVFGIDNVDIMLSGKSTPTTASSCLEHGADLIFVKSSRSDDCRIDQHSR